jgi:RNA polymerase-binding transcription factor DksA
MNKTAARTGFKDTYHLRRLLLSKKAEFLEALGINSHRLAGAELDADPVTRLQEESLNLGLNWVLHGQLRQVDEALDRLDHGEFGYCLACHDSIAPIRLQSVPWAPYCLECQGKTAPVDFPKEIGVMERN